MNRYYWVAIIWLSLSLFGCQPVIDSIQPVQTSEIILTNDQTLGQTFVANFDGLAGVGLAVQPVGQPVGVLELTLKDSTVAPDALHQAVLPLSQLTTSGSSNFYFLPIKKSNQSSYYFDVKYRGSGSVTISAADGEAYLNGAAYKNGRPIDMQLSYELIYAPRLLVSGLVQEFLTWCGWLLVGILLWITPGWGLLCWLHPRMKQLSFWEKVSLAGCLGLCIYPLLLLWSDIFHLSLGRLSMWLLGILGLTAILIRYRKNLLNPGNLNLRSIQPDWPGITLAVGLLLIIAARLWVIRSLDLPQWGDSLQHTMIAQLIVDHGSLFRSWQPYADLQDFTYHFGYHSLAATFHWLQGSTLAKSVMISGQFINVLAVLSLFPLTMRLTNSRWSSVTAVILAGLVFSMPMFYVNWGRYTQLTGLAILAIAVTFLIEIFKTEHPGWSLFILTSLIWAGLALTHYRVFLFGLLFFVAYLLLNLQSEQFIRLIVRGGLCLTGAFLIVLPWFARVFASGSWNPFLNQVSIPANQISEYVRQINTPGSLSFYLPAWAWISLPVITGIGLWKRREVFSVISLWWFLVFLASRPELLNLPGTGLLTSFAVLISAYFPAAMILGAGVGLTVDAWASKPSINPVFREKYPNLKKHYLPVFISLSLIGIGLFFFFDRIKELSSYHALATRPDIQAAEWIKQQLPAEARFLVNSMPAYGETAIVGTDGGWWLPVLAKHSTNLPPLSYLSEPGPQPDYVLWINRLADRVQKQGLDNPEVLNELRKRGIEYIYAGQRQGLVNSSHPLIKLETLAHSSYFELIYHQDRVWIYKMRVKSTE